MQMKACTMETLKGLGRLQETFHKFFFIFLALSASSWLPGSLGATADPASNRGSDGCGQAQLSVAVVRVGSRRGGLGRKPEQRGQGGSSQKPPMQGPGRGSHQ